MKTRCVPDHRVLRVPRDERWGSVERRVRLHYAGKLKRPSSARSGRPKGARVGETQRFAVPSNRRVPLASPLPPAASWRSRRAELVLARNCPSPLNPERAAAVPPRHGFEWHPHSGGLRCALLRLVDRSHIWIMLLATFRKGSRPHGLGRASRFARSRARFRSWRIVNTVRCSHGSGAGLPIDVHFGRST